MTAAAPVGLGLDIVEIDRVESLARSKPRFLQRVFSRQELRYCAPKKRRWQHLSARFAAKEAVWKALGSATKVSLKDISVGKSKGGKPEILIKGKPAPHIQLSLSHSEHYALAVALILPSGAEP